MADLAALLSRIEAAEGPSYELFDTAATTLVHGGGELLPWFAHFHDLIKYRAYLDACAELQARVLPGYYWGLHQDAGGPWFKAHVTKISPVRPIPTIGKARTAALAWLAALVRALIDQHGGE